MMNCFALSTTNLLVRSSLIMQRQGWGRRGVIALGLLAYASTAWSQVFDHFFGPDPFEVMRRVSPAPQTPWEPSKTLPQVNAPVLAPQPLGSAALTLAELTEY